MGAQLSGPVCRQARSLATSSMESVSAIRLHAQPASPSSCYAMRIADGIEIEIPRNSCQGEGGIGRKGRKAGSWRWGCVFSGQNRVEELMSRSGRRANHWCLQGEGDAIDVGQDWGEARIFSRRQVGRVRRRWPVSGKRDAGCFAAPRALADALRRRRHPQPTTYRIWAAFGREMGMDIEDFGRSVGEREGRLLARLGDRARPGAVVTVAPHPGRWVERWRTARTG